jgi:hypothetical protein
MSTPRIFIQVAIMPRHDVEPQIVMDLDLRDLPLTVPDAEALALRLAGQAVQAAHQRQALTTAADDGSVTVKAGKP